MDIITTVPIILIGLISFSAFWTINSSALKTQAISELQTIREDFKSCDVKIFETAKKGLYSVCSFSVKNGELAVGGDTIYYKIVEDGICDVGDWMYIDESNRIKEKCTAYNSLRLYEIEWNSPNIMFQRLGGKRGKIIEFRKLSDILIGSESGYLLSIRIL